MSDNRDEPWAVETMDELLALARAMEQEAIAGYVALAERMRNENRPDLAAVFERLVAEEEGHLGAVDRWISQSAVALPSAVPLQESMFDDEGAALVAPELLNSYRAFSMAVRNEERAFVFWSYVSAHATSEEIRRAAERMAHEELGHVATLRRERRLAFHDLRRSGASPVRGEIAALELRLSDHLEARAIRAAGREAERFRALAEAAQARSAAAVATPFGRSQVLDAVPEGADARLVPLCELLLDCYLDLAEREKQEDERLRAQACAGELIACLQAVRE
ncbi:MAG: ferritin family protein [Rhizobium sp.]|nr:ferritin family protein [Rhizobium sp.]